MRSHPAGPPSGASWLRRRITWVIGTILVLSAMAGTAYAYWASTDSSNFAAAAADSLPQGATPTAAEVNVTTVAVGYARATTTTGRDVTSYTVNRYISATAPTASASFTCAWPSGTTLSCTDTNVPSGTWYYADTPQIASSQWTGAASTRGSIALTPPTVSSALPASRGIGAVSQSVVITGTGFVAGATVSFSNGVVVNSATVNTATQITANISLGSATAGPASITVTNPDQGSGVTNTAFAVNAAPTPTSANPASRGIGAVSQSVVVTGTGFVAGATVSFSNGVVVNSAVVNTATQITANISLGSATVGPATITITNPDQGVSRTSTVFAVIAAPTVASAAPASLGIGATNQNVVITGTGFAAGATVGFSNGVVVNSAVVNGATQITANVALTAATTGSATVTVNNNDAGTIGSGAVFTVDSAPAVISASPNNAGVGATSETVVLSGSGFVSGATVSVSNGVVVNSTTFTNSTHLTLSLNAVAATAGAATITVTNPDQGVTTNATAFSVLGAASITSASPNSYGVGAVSQNLVIGGGNFVAGATVTVSNGVTVNSTTFVSSTQLTASVTLTSATAGPATVTVNDNNGGPPTSSTTAFAVVGIPAITSALPGSIGAGATNQTVVITGSNFKVGATLTVSLGTVNSIVVNSATQITANLNAGSTPGTVTMTVNNNDAGTTGSSATAFKVDADPTVTSASPSSRGIGATNQNVVITGTGFVTGATVTVSNGVTVNSTTFGSATQLTANISLTLATAGASTVTVTNPDQGVGSKTNAFTVDPAPDVTSANPASRGIGATNQNVVITGTGFVTGATVTIANGVVVNSTVVNNGTQVTVNIGLVSATAGPAVITVTNPDQGVGANATVFAVNGTPTISSANPSSLGIGATSQSVVITGTGFATGATVTVSNGVAVNSATINSATQLTATLTLTGATAGPASITVNNNDGGTHSTVTSTAVFTVNPAPTITTLNPSSVRHGTGATTVTITGTGFQGTAGQTYTGTVSMTGSATLTVGTVTFISPTSLTVVITPGNGSGSNGTDSVTVTNPDAGKVTKINAFSVTS